MAMSSLHIRSSKTRLGLLWRRSKWLIITLAHLDSFHVQTRTKNSSQQPSQTHQQTRIFATRRIRDVPTRLRHPRPPTNSTKSDTTSLTPNTALNTTNSSKSPAPSHELFVHDVEAPTTIPKQHLANPNTKSRPPQYFEDGHTPKNTQRNQPPTPRTQFAQQCRLQSRSNETQRCESGNPNTCISIPIICYSPPALPRALSICLSSPAATAHHPAPPAVALTHIAAQPQTQPVPPSSRRPPPRSLAGRRAHAHSREAPLNCPTHVAPLCLPPPAARRHVARPATAPTPTPGASISFFQNPKSHPVWI
ncbi:hypothetical protein Droror1_Dr00016236 [Drosera rotundifolia]